MFDFIFFHRSPLFVEYIADISVRLEVDPPNQRNVVKERGIFSNKLKVSTTELILTGIAKRCLTEEVYVIEVGICELTSKISV